MDVIYPNNILNIQADEETVGFEIENVLDNYPKRVWRAESQSATVIIDVDRYSNAIALFNSNGKYIRFTVFKGETSGTNALIDADFETWVAGSPSSWTKEINVSTTEETGYSGSNSSCKLVATDTTLKSIYQDITVVAGEYNILSLHYKNTAADVAQFRVYDNDNAAVITDWTDLEDKTTWANGEYAFCHTFLAPTGCTSVRISLQPKTNTDIVWFDDVYVIAQEETLLYDLRGIDTYYEFFKDEANEGWDSIWYDYTILSETHRIAVTIDSNDVTVDAQIGVTQAGFNSSFSNPDYGLTEGLQDYSIVKETNNGSFYFRKRDVVRTFQGQISVTRDREFYNFMTNIIRAVGPAPLAYKMTDLSNFDWTVFAMCKTMPKGVHEYYAHSTVSFDLTEVI